MAQILSGKLLTTEARIRFQTSPHVIHSEQSVTGSDVHLSTAALPSQYNSTTALHSCIYSAALDNVRS